MNLKKQKKFYQKFLINKIFKYLSFATIIFVFILFVFFFGFIIKESIQGFQFFGFQKIFLSNTFILQTQTEGVSFWFMLAITLTISFFALLIATPLGVYTSIFIFYRLKKKHQKKISLIIEILAGIPSVIFGVFAANFLGDFISKTIFKLDTSYNLLTAFFMLSFMILPTIISLVLQTLRNTDEVLLTNSLALGVNKTKGIYKIVLKKITPAIFVAVLIALGRAIGETMAVSLILQSEDYTSVFNNSETTIRSFFSSGLRPLGAVISINMFADGAGDEVRSLLFGFGVGILIIVTLLNLTLFFFINKANKNRKMNVLSQLNYYMAGTYNYYKSQVIWFLEKIVFPPAKLLEYTRFSLIKTKENSFFKRNLRNINNIGKRQAFLPPEAQINKKINININNYLVHRLRFHILTNFYSYKKKAIEFFSFFIVVGFLIWILIVITSSGLQAWSSPYSTLFEYTKNSTGIAFINTSLIVIVSILISFPVSLLIAIYLNEYLKSNRLRKIFLLILDVLGSSPSIVFGLFGLSFFILTLGLTASGTMGRSLIVGSLTISIVILPNFIRMMQVHLGHEIEELRNNSLALGATKFYTIRKVILPRATKGIISSIVLSAGRIMGETAPLFLTSGLSSGSNVALNQPGQTLTTRIFAQINVNNIEEANAIMFENALLSIILILFFIILGNVIIPWLFNNARYTFAYFIWKQKNEFYIQVLSLKIVSLNFYQKLFKINKFSKTINDYWLQRQKLIVSMSK